MKKFILIFFITLSMLSGGVVQAANKSVPKDPRKHKVINSNLITLNNKLNDTSFYTYILP